MSAEAGSYDEVLARAAEHARSWLASLGERPVRPPKDADALLAGFGGPLPEQPAEPEDVIDLLARLAEPGLMASSSGRFFGFVIGGVLPAALAADWLVSAWDQNATLRALAPTCVAAEESAAAWLLDLFGLPAGCDVGFVTGATMANFTGLAAARTAVLQRAGWDLAAEGLTGAPRVQVLVGAERHDTIDLTLRYLGLGAPQPVTADDQGRIRVDALDEALSSRQHGGPTIVCLQAGNVHSGSFDPLAEAIEVAHRHGAWVHVDGAFGLWAAAAPSLRHLVEGIDGADSWASDAHKTLNVGYDCGIAIVADPRPLRATMGIHADYLLLAEAGPGDPLEKVPEMSRRARGVPVWAALRSLGRAGVAGLVERLANNARAIAEGLAQIDGVRVLNEVVYTQVCVALRDDETTRAVAAQLIAEGTVWMSGSRWHGQDVLRVSVSNWSTDDEDVRRSVDAVRRAIVAVEAPSQA